MFHNNGSYLAINIIKHFQQFLFFYLKPFAFIINFNFNSSLVFSVKESVKLRRDSAMENLSLSLLLLLWLIDLLLRYPSWVSWLLHTLSWFIMVMLFLRFLDIWVNLSFNYYNWYVLHHHELYEVVSSYFCCLFLLILLFRLILLIISFF